MRRGRPGDDPRDPSFIPEAGELSRKAWKIYLAELSEEGVELFDDASAGKLVQRSFKLAEIFLRYQSHRVAQLAAQDRDEPGDVEGDEDEAEESDAAADSSPGSPAGEGGSAEPSDPAEDLPPSEAEIDIVAAEADDSFDDDRY
jgi:hypothetical protein